MRILCAKYTTTLPNIIKIFNNRKFSSIFTIALPLLRHSPPFHFNTKSLQNAQFPLHIPPPRTHFPLLPLFIYQIITFTPLPPHPGPLPSSHIPFPHPGPSLPHPAVPSLIPGLTRDLLPSTWFPLPFAGAGVGGDWRRCRGLLAQVWKKG